MVDNGPLMTRRTTYGNPEVVLDDERAAAMRRGMELAIATYSREWGSHRYVASLIGFTRAQRCVMGPL